MNEGIFIQIQMYIDFCFILIFFIKNKILHTDDSFGG